MHCKALTSAAVISSIALVCAQDLSLIPACARDSVASVLGSTGCPLTDTACICASSVFTGLAPSIVSVCSPDDVDLAIAAGQTICAAARASSSTTILGSSPTPVEPAGDPTVTGEEENDISTITIPGTVTSTSLVPDTTSQPGTIAISSISTTPTKATHSASTVAGTITAHSSTSGSSTGTSTSWQSTYTGSAASQKAQGVIAAIVSLLGIVTFV